MEITLEKIELVKDRTGVTYAEAKEALEEAEAHHHIQEDDVASHEGVSLAEVTALLQPP